MSPEGAIKKAICDYLSFRQDCFFWVQESQGTYDAKMGGFRKKKSAYQRNGVPDILCMMSVGTLPPIFIGLEVKTKSNKQTPSQIQFEKEYKEFGGLYYVVRSAEEAQLALRNATQLIKSRIPARQI